MGLIFFPPAAARFAESSAFVAEPPLRRWRAAGFLLFKVRFFLAIVRCGGEVETVRVKL